MKRIIEGLIVIFISPFYFGIGIIYETIKTRNEKEVKHYRSN